MRLSDTVSRLQSQRFGRLRLPFPTNPKLKVAQVSLKLLFAGVKAFASERWIELEIYRPHVLAGTAADLQRISERLQLGTLDLASVDHAIFVITECGDKPLSDIMRVLFWQTFAVPIFELYVGPHGSLLASECQAHEGWHVEAGAAILFSQGELIFESPQRKLLRTGLAAEVNMEPCPCGRHSTRLLVEARPLRDDVELVAIAS